MIAPFDGFKYNGKLFPGRPFGSEIGNKLATNYYPRIEFTVAWRHDDAITDELRLHTRISSQPYIDLSVTVKIIP